MTTQTQSQNSRIFSLLADGSSELYELWSETGEAVLLNVREKGTEEVKKLLVAHGSRKGIKAPPEMCEEADLITCCYPAANPHLADKMLFPQHNRQTWSCLVFGLLIEATESHISDRVALENNPFCRPKSPIPLTGNYHWREW